MLVAARHDKRKIDLVRKKLRQTVREETACKEKFDFRVAGAEPIDGARQDLARQGRRDRNTQLLEFSRSRCRDGCGGLIGVCGNRFGVRKKTASGSIEPQSQGRSLKERTAELLVELTHRFGNGRLREAEFIGGAARRTPPVRTTARKALIWRIFMAMRTSRGRRLLAVGLGRSDAVHVSRTSFSETLACRGNKNLAIGVKRLEAAQRGADRVCAKKDAGPSCRQQPCRKDLPFRDVPRSNAGLRVRRSR